MFIVINVNVYYEVESVDFVYKAETREQCEKFIEDYNENYIKTCKEYNKYYEDYVKNYIEPLIKNKTEKDLHQWAISIGLDNVKIPLKYSLWNERGVILTIQTCLTNKIPMDWPFPEFSPPKIESHMDCYIVEIPQ